MATLSNQSDGRRIIYLNRPGRPKISLGRVTKKQATTIQGHVEELVRANLSGSAPRDTTAAWLADIGDTLRARLIKLGLAEPVQVTSTDNGPSCLTLDDARAIVLRRNTHWAEKTKLGFEQAIDKAVAHFGAAHNLLTVTRGEVLDYHGWMTTKGKVAASTAGRYLKSLNLCYVAASDDELTDRNPVVGVKKTRAVADKRILTADETKAIEKELPPRIRTVWALARYGGLRCNSEIRQAKWEGVDWKRERLRFWDSKRKAYRTIPIFPELKPYIDQAWDDAKKGEELIAPYARRTKSTLDYTLEKAVVRAGLEMWPSPWHSLRATRENELLTVPYAAHVVAAWIGHTVQVQQAAYAQVTDADFDRGVSEGALQGAERDCGADSGAVSNCRQETANR